MIPTPTKALYDSDTRLTRLYFDHTKNTEMDGNYYCRGAISWPMPMDAASTNNVTGLAIMAGQRVDGHKPGKLYIFEEFPFLVIESQIGEGGKIEYDGLAPWLSRMYAKYFSRTYFTNQADEVQTPFIREILRSDNTLPKPQIMHTTWSSDKEGIWSVWSMLTRRVIAYSAEGHVCAGLIEMETRPGIKPGPAAHAATCLATGLAQHPWRPIRIKPKIGLDAD